MNILDQVKHLLKEEIEEAVVKAGLAKKKNCQQSFLRYQKIKQMVTLRRTWRCS